MPNDALDAISVPELRRRVDRAIALLRGMRRELAVEAGMTLEDAPGPIPEVDIEESRICFDQMMATLPLLQKRLTPEERAKLHPVSAVQQERMKAVLDEVIAQKDLFEKVAEEGELPVSHEQIVKLRESLDKTDMLREFERELQAHIDGVSAFRRTLEELVTEDAARIASRDEPAN